MEGRVCLIDEIHLARYPEPALGGMREHGGCGFIACHRLRLLARGNVRELRIGARDQYERHKPKQKSQHLKAHTANGNGLLRHLQLLHSALT